MSWSMDIGPFLRGTLLRENTRVWIQSFAGWQISWEMIKIYIAYHLNSFMKAAFEASARFKDVCRSPDLIAGNQDPLCSQASSVC